MDELNNNQNLEPIPGQPGWYIDPNTGETVHESEFGEIDGDEDYYDDGWDDEEDEDGEDYDRREEKQKDQTDEANEEEGPETEPESNEGSEGAGGSETEGNKNPEDLDSKFNENQNPNEGLPEGGEGLAETGAEAVAETGAEAGAEIAAEAGAEAAAEAAATAVAETAVAGATEVGAAATSEFWGPVLIAIIVIIVIVVLLVLAFIGFGSDSASGLTPGGATAFSCEGKNYVFPYQNKDVPSIPKTHHDYSAIDLMSADGEPLVAVTDGTVRNPHSADTGDGGIGFTIIGDDGYYYYYAHLEYLDPSITKGSRISAGQFVGRSGHTGNASASSPHLHFGISKGEQVKGFYPSMVFSPPQNPAQVSPWKTLEAWKDGQCITPGT